MASRMEDFQVALLHWYDLNRRELPWRLPRGDSRAIDPWHVLVSEFMLQQTQVVTVIPYFLKFIAEFPTASHLALAPSEKVLRHWQGLGYYSRARYLHAAAKVIAEKHAGELPDTLEELRSLAGVGPYTAGAVASIAFGVRAPIVDGNVTRLLARLHAIRGHVGTPKIRAELWRKSAAILPHHRIGDFNSALMELGAMVCTPRNPDCPQCPVQKYCVAFARGLQNEIPTPRKARLVPTVRRWIFCLKHRNRWLIERRPETGRWAGLWQFITIPAGKKSPISSELQQATGQRVSNITRLARIDHRLTHRQYIFTAFSAEVAAPKTINFPRRWITLAALKNLPMSKAQLGIAKLLGGNEE